ncbi:MAG: hypothetical protein LWY06_17505 [Firmicutes bacterium]|nr:hypothetical protein [Bacillota bacterium]
MKLFSENKNIFVLCILLTITIITTTAASEIPRTPLEESGHFTTYNEMITYLKKIEKRSTIIKITETGKSANHNTPLYAVRIDTGSKPDDEKLRIMITARVHGSEPAGMEAAIRFIRDMAFRPEYKYISDEATFMIIPCANPDGTATAIGNYRENGGFWDKTGRYNSQILDINRDFNAAETPETRNCISVFNQFKPHLVIDLHEFAGTPVVAGEEGWWRGRYFDELIGAGRNPDVYPPISHFSRMICENILFPELKAKGIRTFYYPSASGNLDTTYRFGATGADYYNLRNSFSFLIETGIYDQGESTIKKRTDRHIFTLGIIIREFIKNKKAVIKMTEDSKTFSKERTSITIKQKLVPYEAEIDGRKASDYIFTTNYNVDGKTYKAVSKVYLRAADPARQETKDLPAGYAVICQDSEFIEKLLLHGIQVYETESVIRTDKGTLPAHVFYIPASQESSAILSFIMEPDSYRKNRFALVQRAIINPVENSIDLNQCKRILTTEDINNTIERFYIFMEDILKNSQQK